MTGKDASGQGGRSRQFARIASRVGVVVALVLAFLVPLAGRNLVDGRAELRAADAAMADADVDAEIRHLGRAARFRLPLASHDEQALDRLEDLAHSAEEAGEISLALAAWRELRGALLGTRTLDVGDRARLRTVNGAIVELMVREAEASGRPIARDRWAAELDQDLGPRGRGLLASLCFVGWLLASVGFFVRAIDAKGRLELRPATRWGGAVVVLLVAWILLM